MRARSIQGETSGTHAIGELGTRLVFAVPMLLLAYAAWREA